MRRRQFAMAIPTVAILALLGRTVQAEQRSTSAPESTRLQDAVRSNNSFAIDLYRYLQSAGTGNIFFSPTSISTALAMTYAGAEGVTEEEMREALSFTLPDEQLHAAYAELLARLDTPENETYVLRVANRLWGQSGYGFLPDFTKITRQRYGAGLEQVDFVRNSEQARRTINHWVEQQTNDRIQDLLSEGLITSMTRLVLVNAIYFKGKWKQPFDPQSTADGTFHVSADAKVEVPFMSQTERFLFATADGVQVLAMPYAGDDLSMVILLPQEQAGLPALERRLTLEKLEGWLSQLRSTRVRVELPRFKLSQRISLNAALSNLGMPSAFIPGRANFSAMNGKEDLYISAAVHQAFVDVNEEGTEAAGATGIVIGRTSLPLEPPVFRADHPFLFLIRDNRTGSVLFLGRVVNPNA